METTDKIDTIFENYFRLPYKPEYLVKTIKKNLDTYPFKLVNYSQPYKENFNNDDIIYKIFRIHYHDYQFINNISNPRTKENFKNFLYEQSKVPKNRIKKKTIILYIFLFEDYTKWITDTIYNTVEYFNFKYSIYENIFYYLFNRYSINKTKFDRIYLTQWITNKLKLTNNKNSININKNDNIHINTKEINIGKKMINDKYDNNIFSEENIKLNLIKYEYFGPNETKLNYVLNEMVKKDDMNVVLYSANYLIENNLSKEYEQNDFQIFNENNDCPNLFKYMLNDAIKELNNKIYKKEINNIIDSNDDDFENYTNDNMITDIGIIKFNDNTIGLYLNILNPSHYFEMKNLLKGFYDEQKEANPKPKPIEYSTGTITEATSIKEENEITDEQKFYLNYNSLVNEEQIANSIICSINDDIKASVERLPRIIYYLNIFLLNHGNNKKKIPFIKKQKNYGFDEADGVFYVENNDLTINKNDKIPFLKTMSFDLYNEYNNNQIICQENPIDSKIVIKKNTFVYMEEKISFPLKFDKSNNCISDKNEEDFKKLIRNIIRKSKKFSEIAIKKGKNIEKIHILMFYNSLLQNSSETRQSIKKFNSAFSKISINLEKSTTFEVIFFANPSTINFTKFSQSMLKSQKENKEKIVKLQKENEDQANQIKELKKQNEEQANEFKGLKKQNEEQTNQINELKKQNEDQVNEFNELKKQNEDQANEFNELKKQNKEKSNEFNELKKQNEDQANQINELSDLIKKLQTQIEGLQRDKNVNNGNKLNNNLISNNIQYNISDNFMLFINDKISKKEETVHNIKGLKEGLFCLISSKNLYIIQNSSIIKIINGMSNAILPLNNGNIMSSKRGNILIYEKGNFNELKKIVMGCYIKQFIELKNNNILLLSDESSLYLIKNLNINQINKENKIYFPQDIQISSIVESINSEVIIISNNLNKIYFYDLDKKGIAQTLVLDVSNDSASLENNFIHKNYLFVSSPKFLFKINIIEKKIEKKYEYRFAKIYSFNNTFFGINGKIIYFIKDNNGEIEYQTIYEDKEDIKSLFYTEGKKIIFCTDKKVGILENF